RRTQASRAGQGGGGRGRASRVGAAGCEELRSGRDAAHRPAVRVHEGHDRLYQYVRAARRGLPPARRWRRSGDAPGRPSRHEDAIRSGVGEIDRSTALRQGGGRQGWRCGGRSRCQGRREQEMSRRILMHCRMLLLAAAASALAGCAVGPSKEDPFEPFNRSMFEVNEGLNTVLVKPVAEGYVAIVPEVIRTGVSNVFGNLDDLFTGINGLLQGNGYRAGNAFGRVLLNSFMGIGGIFDLATMAGIAKDHNDFGITFGKWGFPNGPYLFIPAIGPTTVRDGSGYLVRLAVG